MKVLCIGDLHNPVTHPGYLPFCKDLYEAWRCNAVMFMGDVVDSHAISAHAANPMCPAAGEEYRFTREQVARWVKAFPKARVCIGNHDERPERLASVVNIPAKYYMRPHAELWDTPGWDWQYSHIIDDVYYFHGTGRGGVHPAWNASAKVLMSVVMGHTHSRSGITWRAGPVRRTFSMDVGCGINASAYQFAYGAHMLQRPILSAAVVLDGIPYHEIMPCGAGEKYHKARFK